MTDPLDMTGQAGALWTPLHNKLTTLFSAWEQSHAACHHLADLIEEIVTSHEARANFLHWDDEFIKGDVFRCDSNGDLVHNLKLEIKIGR